MLDDDIVLAVSKDWLIVLAIIAAVVMLTRDNAPCVTLIPAGYGLPYGSVPAVLAHEPIRVPKPGVPL